MKSNYKLLDDILEACDIIGVDKLKILKFVPQGRGRENRRDLMLSNDEMREFINDVDKLRLKYTTEISLGTPLTKEDHYLCTAGHNKWSIRYDGAIFPCVAFKELDIIHIEEVFRNKGIETPMFSIYDDNFESKMKFIEGSIAKPICKEVYGDI